MKKLLRQFSSDEFEALIKQMKGGSDPVQDPNKPLDPADLGIIAQRPIVDDSIIKNFEMILDTMVGTNRILSDYMSKSESQQKESSMEQPSLSVMTSSDTSKRKLSNIKFFIFGIKQELKRIIESKSESGGLSVPGVGELGLGRLGGLAGIGKIGIGVAAAGAVGYGLSQYENFGFGSGTSSIGLEPNSEVLDNIAKAEGTFSTGYNTSLANGKFLPGGREQNLIGMTLEQILSLQRSMLNHPQNNYNSSALGRYQIVSTTLREAAKGLGYDLRTTKFTPEVQDRMAMWILKNQGFGAWEGFKKNPENLMRAQAALRQSGATINAEDSKGRPTGPMADVLDSISPNSTRINSGFGMRMHPTLGVRKMHTGIDLNGKVGDPVKSIAEGIVEHAGPKGAYGQTVIIAHPDGKKTLYAHLSSIKVSKGQRVSAGQLIGGIGSTGRSTGPHLHFEVIDKSGAKLDPTKYAQSLMPRRTTVVQPVVIKDPRQRNIQQLYPSVLRTPPQRAKKKEARTTGPSFPTFFRR